MQMHSRARTHVQTNTYQKLWRPGSGCIHSVYVQFSFAVFRRQQSPFSPNSPPFLVALKTISWSRRHWQTEYAAPSSSSPSNVGWPPSSQSRTHWIAALSRESGPRTKLGEKAIYNMYWTMGICAIDVGTMQSRTARVLVYNKDGRSSFRLHLWRNKYCIKLYIRS